jgi:hypothetical protein
MFKTETHLHTAETSPCGKVSAAEMVKRYHDAGYKTLFISDHFFTKYFDALGNLSPEEKVEQFLLGYEEAKVAGEELGMNILLSAELRLDGSNNDYLLYGVDKQFLTNASKIFGNENVQSINSIYILFYPLSTLFIMEYYTPFFV